MYCELRQKEVAIASIILAGGKGTRLFPLTLNHSKPAVSFGGRYRIIDIPISNSLNSDIREIYVIGQYLTSELQHHLAETYQFDKFFPGMIDFITPEITFPNEKIWFEGTADAIRKNLSLIYKNPAEYFLILSGDQLYNIDFHEMLSFAIASDADLTIAAIKVKETDVPRLGVLKIDENCQVVDFYEKPKEKEIVDKFRLPKTFFNGKEELTHLGSMAIYIFKREALAKMLTEDSRPDFGHDLIPSEIKKNKTAAYVYNGYWEDIGTISSYYYANMVLTENPSRGIKTYDEVNPIYSQINHLPGTKINGTLVDSSIICEGSFIDAKEVYRSVIGLRSHIKKGSVIKESVLLGNTTYLPPKHQENMPSKFEIGENCLLEKTIVDQHVLIGNNVKLVNKMGVKNYDSNFGIFVRDGIIIVTANTQLPDGFEF